MSLFNFTDIYTPDVWMGYNNTCSSYSNLISKPWEI